MIDIDGVRFELLHWAPAHTSGDLIVHLPQTHVVFTGDIVSMARPDPTIHLGKGGRADGWVETMRGILALKNVSVFVPGHGDIQDRRALERRYEATAKKRDATLAMRSHGKTLDEVLDAQPDGSGPIVRQAGFAEPGFVEVVFRELPIPAVR